MTLSAAERDAAVRLLEGELAWRQNAANLTLEPPTDPGLAKRHLLEFVRWGQPAYEVGWFHRELCGHLEWFSREVAARRSPRLLISAPPRHGKSEIVSRRFPVWHLARNPTHEVVVASYGQDLANRMSRSSRGVRDWAVDWWPALAPKHGGTDGVEFWEIAGGGSYKAVGVGGPLTGGGAHVLDIDDPFKNNQEAGSLDIRESRWEWYTQTAYTRLAPGGGILLTNTRWHEDDISGRIEREFAKLEGWRVVSYPALAETDEPFRKAGEALHPERYTAEYLDRARIILGSRAFASLYQQRPSPAGGALFLRKWFERRFDHDPQRPPKPYTAITISVDATFKAGDGTDYVSMGVWGRYGWVEHHRVDQVRLRLSYVETRQVLRNLCTKWRPGAVLIETKANGEALLDDLRGEIPGLIGRPPDPHGNKVTRAMVATPRFEADEVAFPERAEWVGDYIEEHVAFPAGAHDDMVDDTSQYFLWCQEQRVRIDAGAINRGMADFLASVGG